jgi:hypothetical protein
MSTVSLSKLAFGKSEPKQEIQSQEESEPQEKSKPEEESRPPGTHRWVDWKSVQYIIEEQGDYT